jgi:signal transduction histidine kinase
MTPASASIFLRDPRLTACAASPEPAWLWSVDATRVLWANAAGAALLGSSTVTELTQREFAPNDSTAHQVARLAASLSPEGAPRLERLRGFGTGFMRLLTASCSRVTLHDGSNAIFIAGAEAIGQPLSLAERARRLFEGSDEAIAIATPDGAIGYTTPNGKKRTAGANTLVAFNGSALASAALSNGASAGDTLAGPVSIVRIGQAADILLIVRLGISEAEARTPVMAMPASVTPTPVEKPVAPVEIEAPVEVTPITTAVVEAVMPLEEVKLPEVPASVVTAPAAPVADGPKTLETETAQAAAPLAVEPAASETPAPVAVEPPAAVVPTEISTPPEATPAPAAAIMDRQHPLRFVWQMDAGENFTLVSQDFVDLIGPVTAQVLGKPWATVSAALQLDPEGEVARAIATRDTWSGVTVQWPVDDSALRLKIELSGLPIYDRQRTFTGYRGFGVCRDIETFAAIMQERRDGAARPQEAKPAVPPATPPTTATPLMVESAAQRAAEAERVIFTVVPPVQNVLPFRAITPTTPAAEIQSPSLNDGERNAFSEIARQLSARLKSAATPALRANATPGTGIDGRANLASEELPPEPDAQSKSDAATRAPAWLTQGSDAHALVDKLPLGVLIYRFDTLFYANRSFLDQVGYATLQAFVDAGGLDSLFIETEGGNPNSGSQNLTITTGRGDQVPVEGRLFSIPWNGESALALVLVGASQVRETVPAAALPPQTSAEDLARIAELEASIAEAKRIADEAATERAELLGKLSEQVREPLTSAVSTVDTMLEERFGPIGNERYRAYLSDIRGSGVRILGLFEDVSSLSKAESVKPDAVLPGVNLNDVIKAAVAKMQPEASRVRVLIRTSLASIALPVSAEADSLTTIVTNLLTSSIRFAGPGGQVIVSSAPAGDGKAVMRLRDTGAGLSAKELALFHIASNPDVQPKATDNATEELTLAITLAMLEANRATIVATSKADDGTMVEVTFNGVSA